MNQYKSDRHHRKSIRLAGYDYSQAGLYFITICCEDRICRFGQVENGAMVLNQYGQIAYDEWMKTPEIRPNVKLHEFVVMPNHIHGIIQLLDIGRGELHSPNDNELHLPNDNKLHSPDNNELHSPDNNKLHSPDDNKMHSPNDNELYLPNDNKLHSPDNNELHSPDNNELHSPDGNELHSPDNNKLHSPNDNEIHSPDDNEINSPYDNKLHLPDDNELHLPDDNELHLSDDKLHLPDDNRGVCKTPLRGPSQTIGAIVRGYKSSVTKQINLLRAFDTPIKLWQRNYHDHIIRNEQSYQRISEYIKNNPAKWDNDKFYKK